MGLPFSRFKKHIVIETTPQLDESNESHSRFSSGPFIDYIFEGSFEDAKSFAARQNLWLIVNLQSLKEMASSRALNRVWLNDTVWQIVGSDFILWQVYDNTHESEKISCLYEIDDLVPPVVLLVDPITGIKMSMWSGVIEAESLAEDLMKFSDVGPYEYIASLTRNICPETQQICDNRVQEEDAWSSSNSAYQSAASSRSEEYEEEDTYWPSNRVHEGVASSWGEEFEKEKTCWLRNYTDKAMSSSSDEELEHDDTCWSSNNVHEVVASSWGEEFEKEDTCWLRTYTDKASTFSSDEESEHDDTCWPSNNVHQAVTSSWGEEFEKEDTC